MCRMMCLVIANFVVMTNDPVCCEIITTVSRFDRFAFGSGIFSLMGVWWLDPDPLKWAIYNRMIHVQLILVKYLAVNEHRLDLNSMVLKTVVHENHLWLAEICKIKAIFSQSIS